MADLRGELPQSLLIADPVSHGTVPFTGAAVSDVDSVAVLPAAPVQRIVMSQVHFGSSGRPPTSRIHGE